MLLHTTTIGEGQPKVALVHGFTQTSNSMLPLANIISSRYTVNLVDAPNHGGSSTFHSIATTEQMHSAQQQAMGSTLATAWVRVCVCMRPCSTRSR
jgi:pimeloyl-ACP methyl ester carboxylesterase